MIDASKHEGLRTLETFPFPVRHSDGFEERADSIARRCARASRFLGEALDFEPNLALLVLSREDWNGRSEYQYGVPSYKAGNLIVAGEPNEFWQGLVELLKDALPEGLEDLRKVYDQPDGDIDLAPFFDLVAVHELGHGFSGQVPVSFPRNWMNEYFANLCMCAYVLHRERESLPVLETLPRLLVRISHERFAHRTLADLEALYIEVGLQNYMWYQSQLILAAQEALESGGIEVLRSLWRRFAMPDEVLLRILEQDVHLAVARVLSDWPGIP